MSAVQKRASRAEAASAPEPLGERSPWAFEVVDRPKGRAMDEAVFNHIREGLQIVAELPENKALKFELRSDDAYSTVRRHFLQVAHVLGLRVMVGHRGRTVFISRLREPRESGLEVVDLDARGKATARRTRAAESTQRGRKN